MHCLPPPMKLTLTTTVVRMALLAGIILPGCATRSPAAAPTGSSAARITSADLQASEARQAETQLKRQKLADAENRAEILEDKADREAVPWSQRHAKEAFDRLTPFAEVKEDPRGMVVILSDSVLFEGTSSELMDTARERLDRVVAAIREIPGKPIVVRGHEDASGDARRDGERSRLRAEAVRTYLASRGVPRERIRVEARGSSEPDASNASPEGRAANRRVEVVIEGAGAAAAQR